MKNNAWFSVLSQFRPPIQNDYHDQQHEVWSSDKIDMPFGVRKEEFYPPRIETKFRPLTPSDQVLISGLEIRYFEKNSTRKKLKTQGKNSRSGRHSPLSSAQVVIKKAWSARLSTCLYQTL